MDTAVVVHFGLSGLLFALFLWEVALAARNRTRRWAGLDVVQVLFFPGHLTDRGRTCRRRALVMLGFLLVSLAFSIYACAVKIP